MDCSEICIFLKKHESSFSLPLYIPFLFNKLASSEENKVFEKIEIEATTDQKALAGYLKMNTVLPDSVSATIPAGTYKAVIRFVIDVHGSMGQVEIKSDPGYQLGKKALGILKNYKGKWKPAVQCGRLVKSYREQVVVFDVEK